MTKYYAVFDTNVIVSALLTSHPDSPTATLLNMVMDGVITPVFNEEIYDAIAMKTCVDTRNTVGAPGKEAMEKVLEKYKKMI